MEFKRDYARRKLKCLIRDLAQYDAEDFHNQMSRISQGATGMDGAEELAKKVARLEEHNRQQAAIITGLRSAKAHALEDFVEQLKTKQHGITKGHEAVFMYDVYQILKNMAED